MVLAAVLFCLITVVDLSDRYAYFEQKFEGFFLISNN